MTREEFWMEVYMAVLKSSYNGSQAKRDANAALAAYDEALKEYGEACAGDSSKKVHLPKLDVRWPEGSLGWAIKQLELGDEFRTRLRRKETGRFPDYTDATEAVYKSLPLVHPCDANALDWEVVP